MQRFEVSGAARPLYGSLGVTGLNGLVRFAERRNVVSARVPSHFNWPVLQKVENSCCLHGEDTKLDAKPSGCVTPLNLTF